MCRRVVRPPVPVSEFAGFRFPPEVIVLAIRWDLRFALSYRDVEGQFAFGIGQDGACCGRTVQGVVAGECADEVPCAFHCVEPAQAVVG